ncbi:isopenicillin-N N-acyltransferase like protein [Clostridium cavendishii DSM 21758]|uniref:Isopenicillin-N N-acyltransferase like protein n=1 Tax=Clostridium cavendishii DSM 21758 TaxID=1121302 RepID=A0A1M6GQJ2_9CLOT|nr:C45 family peptidase [Clostridium cavendishii]SHJ12215.1 isopenicillin-N N-acyltransferase like protein [Clostridium cavendishii DSM 21758]
MKNIKEFKLIECQGTPYEIGTQWGEGCKESILKVSENISNFMEFYYKASQEEIVTSAMKFFPAVQKFDPYLVEIMRGQADATGLSFEEIFTQKCFNELTFAYNNISGLCTSFAATGKATQDGKTILGQNIDFLPEAPIDLLKIHHENGIKQFILSFSNSSEFIFSSAGMGMCANATIGKNYSFNIPVGCYLPKVMRERNINDAMEILKQVARGLGYYHLADINGHMLGIESIHNDFELMYPERDMMVHSNHYITERFKEEDTAPELQPDSYHRLDTISKLMDQNYGHINIEIVKKILENHEKNPKSICRHVDPKDQVSSVTLASFIMIPEDGAIYIAAGNPCECEYVRYEF